VEFIFENPIFIIIIIGMITSFLKRLKGTSPSEGPKEPNWKKVMDIPPIFEEMPTSREVSAPKKEQVEHQSKLLQDYYQVKNKEIARDSSRENTRKESQRISKAIEKPIRQESNVLTPDKEKMIDGIIWSEILGPPRSVKSHAYRRTSLRR
jgi:hypothetical protein